MLGYIRGLHTGSLYLLTNYDGYYDILENQVATLVYPDRAYIRYLSNELPCTFMTSQSYYMSS